LRKIALFEPSRAKIRRRVSFVGEFLKKSIWIATKIFAYISPICREAPLKGICIKFCMTGFFADVINRAKFYFNQIRGFDAVGVEFLVFP